MDLITLIIQWLVIFWVNIIPAFAPPTWLVLSYFHVTSPQNFLLLILLGVTASTAGRYVLAKFSGKLFVRFASEKKKKEIDLIKEKLQKKSTAKFMLSFIFSLGPLPSNAFFIAVGSTKLKLKEFLLGFFAGRTISYLFLVYTSGVLFSSFGDQLAGDTSLVTLGVEIIGVIAIIAFFLIDWTKLIDLIDKKK